MKAVAEAVRAEAGGRLGRFYAPRGYWPLWVHDGRVGGEAQALLAAIGDARLDGLDPDRYDVKKVRAAVAAAAGGDPRALAKAELALSGALAAYVRDVRRAPETGITYLDPTLEPGKLRPEEVLRAAERAPDFPAYIRAMGWVDPAYAALRAAYAKAGPDRFDAAQRRRVRLTLDRLRVLPGVTVKHITVDAASATLAYYDKGEKAGSMRVVAGTAETPTPMLAGMVRYAILNPYWNVPPDLVARKIAPKVIAGRSLAAMRYEALADWSRNPAPLDPARVDWPAVAAGKAEVRVRQLPGGSNAMGRVKFMFPNNEGIYLHDTPQKQLMTKTDRHLSNGCVRLQDAAKLGRWLMGAKFAPQGKAPEQIVPLDTPVPVYLTYLTAQPSADGIRFLPDVYGRDGK